VTVSIGNAVARPALSRPQANSPRARLAIGLLLAFVVAKLLAHFLATFLTPYGIHRDEFLYLAMGKHPQFWGMDFMVGQVWMLGPAILLSAVGLAYLLAARSMRPYGEVSWACVTAFMALLVLHGKAHYIGPIYPLLFAAGAAALGTLPPLAARRANAVMLVLIIAWGAIGLPFGLPVVPPPQMAKYAAAVGITGAVTTNQGKVLSLPQDYADMLGWEEQVEAVAQIYESLPPDKRGEAVLIARNYGEAGALDCYGPRHGLPRVLLPHNNLLWPPPAKPADVVVSLGISTDDLCRFFRPVRLVAVYDDPWRVPEERNSPICVAETLYQSLDEAWPGLKR
jgi:hypothetical protein